MACKRRRGFVWVTVVFLAIGGVQWACAQESGHVIPNVGDKAPPIELEGLLQASEGASTKAEALLGKVVVLEFWSTWCGPCVAAFPHLNELAARFKGKPVQFISITDESREVVERFLKKRTLKTWVGLDTDRSVFHALRIEGIPRTVIIDTEGKIAALTSPGQVTEQVLRDLLAGKSVTLTDFYTYERKDSSNEDPKGKPLVKIIIYPSDPPDRFGGWSQAPGYYRGRGIALRSLIARAYRVSDCRVVGPAALDQRYDVVVSIPPSCRELLPPLFQSTLQAGLGISTHLAINESDVYTLGTIAGTKAKIRKAPGGGGHSSQAEGVIVAVNWDIQGLVDILQDKLGVCVVDETALEGKYDWDIQYNEGDPSSLIQAVRDQLGLELIKTKRPVEFLVVEESVGEQDHTSTPGE